MKKSFDFILVIILISIIVILLGVISVSIKALNNSWVDKSIYPILAIVFFVIVLVIVFAIVFLKYLLKNRKKDVGKTILKVEKIPIEFEELYNKLYNINIHKLEIMRDEVKLRTIIQWIFTTIFIIGYVYIDSGEMIFSTIDVIIIVVTIISCIIAAYFIRANYKYNKNYRETYKTNIISNFIKLVDEKLTYMPFCEDNSSMEEEYRKAGFDNKQFNKIDLDDYIAGNIDDEIAIKIVDVNAQYISGTGENKREEQIFQGIFSLTNSNTNIGNYIKIMSNKITFGKSDTRVQMDSEEFEKIFDVYSNDKIVAMRVLTSDIMELLVDFTNKYGIEFEIIIKNNNIYTRFHTGAMFEPSTFKNSMHKEILFTYFIIFKFILEITKKINLALDEIEV